MDSEIFTAFSKVLVKRTCMGAQIHKMEMICDITEHIPPSPGRALARSARGRNMSYVVKAEGSRNASRASLVESGELEGLGEGVARCATDARTSAPLLSGLDMNKIKKK